MPPVVTVELVTVALDGEACIAAAFDDKVDALSAGAEWLELQEQSILTRIDLPTDLPFKIAFAPIPLRIARYRRPGI